MINRARKGPGLPLTDYPFQEHLPGGCQKKGYSLSLNGVKGSSVPSLSVLEKSVVLMGMNSRGIYLPPARISRIESCRIRKNCQVLLGDRTQNSRAVTRVRATR